MICSDGTVEEGTHEKLLSIPNSRYSAAWKNFILHEAEKQQEEAAIKEQTQSIVENNQESK